MAEPRAEEIEVALGGIYHLSDGRSFWMDALAVREILRRMQPFRAVQEAEIERLKAEVERWRSQSDAAEKAEAERAEKSEALLADAEAVIAEDWARNEAALDPERDAVVLRALGHNRQRQGGTGE